MRLAHLLQTHHADVFGVEFAYIHSRLVALATAFPELRAVGRGPGAGCAATPRTVALVAASMIAGGVQMRVYPETTALMGLRSDGGATFSETLERILASAAAAERVERIMYNRTNRCVAISHTDGSVLAFGDQAPEPGRALGVTATFSGAGLVTLARGIQAPDRTTGKPRLYPSRVPGTLRP